MATMSSTRTLPSTSLTRSTSPRRCLAAEGECRASEHLVDQVTQFALLGLGTGAIYALLGQGIVVIYRGSGTVNFAHGAMAMVGAFLFWELRSNHGLPFPAALR